MSFRVRLAVVLGLFSTAAVAAAHAQVAVYAMGSGAFVGSTGTLPGESHVEDSGFSTFGGTFGVYDDFLRLGPIKIGADARYFEASGSNGTTSEGNRIKGGTGGLRVALKLPVIPFKPYLQAEVGGVDTNYGFQANETSSFAYEIQGGLDYTLLPHLDLRAEYGGGQFAGVYSGYKQSLQEAGVGLVLRF